MCNQSNVPSITLQTAVLMQVTEFAQANQPFSVHDITRNVRYKTAQGEWEIPEVEVSGASFRFDIRHDKISELFKELWTTGVFDPSFKLSRKSNGTYYQYTPVPVTTPSTPPATVPSAPPTPVNLPPSMVSKPATPVLTPPQQVPARLSRSEVIQRVDSYLLNCKGLNRFPRPTLKQVQSAIKRSNASTGWTCAELKDLIQTTLTHFQIVSGVGYVSELQVTW